MSLNDATEAKNIQPGYSNISYWYGSMSFESQ